MQRSSSAPWQRGLVWIPIGSAAAYAVWVVLQQPLDPAPGTAVLLAAAAVLAARIHARAPRAPRFAATFVLAALALSPPPEAIFVALAAAAAARGGGVAGTYRRGLAAFAALAGAATLAQVLAVAWFANLPPAPPESLLGVTLAFLTLQFVAMGLGHALAPAAAGRPGRPPASIGERWRPPLLELLNVPLAWLLVAAVEGGQWLHAAGIAGLALFVGWTLLRLGLALHELRATNDALAERLGELGTLHAIGREILASLDPDRVLAIVDRECSKIFDVDACTVALIDRDTGALTAVLRRRRGEYPERAPWELRAGLASEVCRSKLARRIDDVAALPEGALLAGDPLQPESRSALAVPLIVEERVIGVIVLESRSPRAYDAHQAAVLNTIAQQAAVAIENARNYTLATVDSLTGFYARDHFFRRLEEEHRRVGRYGGQFALLMLDLDGFKAINDHHGHLAGDRYLKAIAETVRGQLRDADLPARFGGDEFCVLLPETTLDGAQVIAERIRRAVAETVLGRDDAPVQTTVSVGIAAFPDHDPGKLQGLVRNADEALYRAKRAGRNCVVPFAA